MKPQRGGGSNLRGSQPSPEIKPRTHSSIRSKAEPSPPPLSTYQSKGPDAELPWTYRYIKHKHLIFDEFKAYTQSLLEDMVADLPKAR